MDITLDGSNGRIQASYHPSGDRTAPIAVVFHDMPSQGGSMNEPVAYTLFYTFLKKGFSVLRFNFRGVGATEGEFEGGEPELADASTAVDWIQRENEEARQFWLAGVGFGAWIALQMLMRRIEVTNYIVARPPYKKFDLSFFNPAPCPGLVIGASEDQQPNEETLKAFIQVINRQRAGKATLAMIPGADASFRDRLGPLHAAAGAYVDKLKDMPPARAERL